MLCSCCFFCCLLFSPFSECPGREIEGGRTWNCPNSSLLRDQRLVIVIGDPQEGKTISYLDSIYIDPYS